jgi:serine protease Do
VTSTARGDEEGRGSVHPFFDDPFFRRFFGEPEEQQRGPQQPPPRVGAGSGFIISSDGYVMTNNHVIEDFERIDVTLSDGRSFKAEVIGTDPSIDLALLKIDPAGRNLPTLPLGDSNELRVGEWVIAIGNPHDFDHTVTVGVVSGKERRVPLPGTDGGVVSFIQTDAAINLGNSGGPLIDARGNVVGINTAIRRQNFTEGIGFALPINQARAVVDQLRERGEVRRGWIGILMNNTGIDETMQEYYKLPDTHGVLINRVEERGPAEAAGLQRGDVIREVDGLPVRDNLDMISKISSRQPGEKVRLTIIRGGQELKKTVTLGDRQEGLDTGEEPTPGPGGGTPEAEREPEQAEGLGLKVETLTDRVRQRLGFEEGQKGLIITEVDFDSEASRKGVQPSLLVVAVNDHAVENVADWTREMERLSPGGPVKLDLVAPDGSSVFLFLRAPER